MGDESSRKARENHTTPKESTDPQWERANQAWALHLEVDPVHLSTERKKELFAALRVKRTERPAFMDRLPGVVRRGAQIDLAPLEALLRKAGFECRLERTRPS